MQSKGRNWQPVKFIEKPHEQDQGRVPGFYSWLGRLIGDGIIMTLPLGTLVYVGCSVFIGCKQSCCPHWQLPLRQPLAAAYGGAVCSQASLKYMPCIPNCESADGTYTVKRREKKAFDKEVILMCFFSLWIWPTFRTGLRGVCLFTTKAGRLAACPSLILLQPLARMNHSII